MRTFRTRSGPFAERPYYTTKDVEQICKSELMSSGLYPSSPEPIRIERFIEKRFNVAVLYDDLPPGVLGWTTFGPKGVETIVVARSLSEDVSRVAERRVSTTLAHEAGHGLLHGHLFALEDKTPSLFGAGSDVKGQRILCRDDLPDRETGKRKYSGRWWEFQANQAMSALLLPRELVEAILASLFEPTGSLGSKWVPSGDREAAVRLLSSTFEVNPVVARIRLNELYPVAGDAQLTL